MNQGVCDCNKRTGGRIHLKAAPANERLTNKGMGNFRPGINEPAVAE
jgi:hypothetical protein